MTIYGSTGSEIFSGSSNMTITMDGASTAFGGTDASTTYRPSGSEIVESSGDVVMSAGDGSNEALYAGTGNVSLSSRSGSDTLFGDTAGDATLSSGLDDTEFVGVAGVSTAIGGMGRDTFYTGSGRSP